MRVSIIVPTRNRPDTLAIALQSIRQQTYEFLDIIVVDDASDDFNAKSNISVTSKFGEGVQYFYLPAINGRPQGAACSRNFGVRNSCGDIVGFCDDDDYWLDGQHLEVVANYLSENSEIDVIYANQLTAFEGSIISRVWQPDFVRHIKGRARDINNIVRLTKAESMFSCDRFPHLNATLYRRRLFELVGGFSENLTFYQDLDFFLRAVDSASGLCYMDADVSVHNRPNRSRSSNLSSDLGSVERALWDADVTRRLAYTCHDPFVSDYARRLTATHLRDLSLLYVKNCEFDKAALAARTALAWRFSIKWLAYTSWLGLKAIN
jgi:glycosyltransferase involved in cell wall biosynthesis